LLLCGAEYDSIIWFQKCLIKNLNSSIKIPYLEL
jgi:hypothetical protein